MRTIDQLRAKAAHPTAAASDYFAWEVVAHGPLAHQIGIIEEHLVAEHPGTVEAIEDGLVGRDRYDALRAAHQLTHDGVVTG